MGRAILAISGSAISLLPRPFTAIGGIFAVFWRELTRDAVRPYRPELHYMRGPGPAWRAKHGLPPGKRTDQHQERRSRKMKIGEKSSDALEGKGRMNKNVRRT